jgi:hypothetical protein
MKLHQIINLVLALLAASLAPATVFGVLGGTLPQTVLAFIIALIHSFVLGLPLFLLLRNKLRNLGIVKSLIFTVILGFVISIIPWGLLTWPLKASSLIMKTNTWIGPDHVQTIKNGIPTLAGWIKYFQSLVLFGPFGALGGFTFWITLKLLGDLHSPKEKDIEGTTQVTPVIPSHKRIRLFTSAAIIIFTIAMCAIPAITADRSCHNMFRDGRTSIGPVVHWDLEISDSEWPKLKELLESFATTHHLSFRDESDVKPGVVRAFYVSACNEDGVNIEIGEQRWASENYENPTGIGVSIGIYITKDDAGWIPLTKELIANLETQWPGKIQFKGDRGETVPKPKILSDDN